MIIIACLEKPFSPNPFVEKPVKQFTMQIFDFNMIRGFVEKSFQTDYKKWICISRPSAFCLVPGPGPGSQFVFTSPGRRFVFTCLGRQFVFTGPSPQLVFNSLGLEFVFTGPGPKFVFSSLGPKFVFTGPDDDCRVHQNE